MEDDLRIRDRIRGSGRAVLGHDKSAQREEADNACDLHFEFFD